MSPSVRVLVADDHPALLRAVKKTLEADDFVVCAEAASAREAVEAAVRERPDLCLLDVQMPGNGITAAREIAAALPETTIVMLTVSTAEQDLFEALRAGAVGYLLKDTDPGRLPLILRAVLNGEAAMPRSLVGHVVRELRRMDERRLPLPGRHAVKLTAREWEVLDLMRDGQTTAEIAAQLTLSTVTVRRHIGAIVRKLDATDRASALALVDTNGSGSR